MNPLLACTALLLAAPSGSLPKVDGVRAVASVNGEPISLEAYRRSLGELHAQVHEGGPKVERKDPAQLLDRLVKLRLLLQEARAIGLHEQPEFLEAVRSWRREAMRAALLRYAVRDVGPPTEAEIARRFGDEVRQYRIRPMRFSSAEGAQAFLASVKAGAEFEGEGKRLADEGKAFVEEDGWIARRESQPALVAALDGLLPGAMTGVVPITGGAVVVKLLELREPDDPEMRKEAVRIADAVNKNAALAAFVAKLRADNTKIDQGVYGSLDYETDPGAIDTYLKDERTLVKVKGQAPILVKDYTAVLKARFFHGVQRAGEKKRLNRAKENVLEEVVTERVLDDAAVRLRLDKIPEFQADQVEFEEATLFGFLARKVVEPSVHVTQEAVQAYYEAHQAEFTAPEMVRLDVISFREAEAAQTALERLLTGADLAWMRAHAESQIDRATLPDEERFEGRVLTLDTLPAALRQAVEGADAGSYRRWTEAPGKEHVVLLRDRVAASSQPLAAVQDEVARRVFLEARNTEVDLLAAKLRAAADIEVFADGEQLAALLLKSAAAGSADR